MARCSITQKALYDRICATIKETRVEFPLNVTEIAGVMRVIEYRLSINEVDLSEPTVIDTDGLVPDCGTNPHLPQRVSAGPRFKGWRWETLEEIDARMAVSTPK